MAWKDIVTLGTDVAETVKTAYVLLAAKETAHVWCDRTDAGSTDIMVIQLWGSIDGGTTQSDTPLLELQVDPADDAKDFTVQGVYSFAISQRNIGASGDAITMTTKYRLDNGIA